MATVDVVYIWGLMGNASDQLQQFNSPQLLANLGTGGAPTPAGAVTMVDGDAGDWYIVSGGLPYGVGTNTGNQIDQTANNPALGGTGAGSSTTPQILGAIAINSTNIGTVGSPLAWSSLATLPILQCDGGDSWQWILDSAGNVFSLGSGAVALGQNYAQGVPATNLTPTAVYAVGSTTGATKLILKPAYGCISGGSSHTLGIQAAGTVVSGKTTVVACGDDTFGECGDGVNVSNSSNPGYCPTFATISPTAGFTNGSATATCSSAATSWQGIPVQGTGIPGGSYVGTVTAGVGFLLSSSATSQVNVNFTGTTGSITVYIGANTPLPIQVLTGAQGDASGFLTGVTFVSTGNKHCIALLNTSTNNVMTWGENSFGQLGDGTTTNRSLPVFVDWPVTGKVPVFPIVQIFGGGGATTTDGQTFAVDSVGNLFAWGANSHGQLGLGNFNSPQLTPKWVAGPAGSTPAVVSGASGARHGIYLDVNNDLWVMGQGAFGALGLGGGVTGSNINTPTLLTTLPSAGVINLIMAGNNTSVVKLTVPVIVGAGSKTKRRVGAFGLV